MKSQWDALSLPGQRFMAPLPRAWQWLDGSAFESHGNLMPKVFRMDPLPRDRPLMYQGISDHFYGPHDDIPLPAPMARRCSARFRSASSRDSGKQHICSRKDTYPIADVPRWRHLRSAWIMRFTELPYHEVPTCESTCLPSRQFSSEAWCCLMSYSWATW